MPATCPPEFNVAQQWFLAQGQVDKAWHWSALRPLVVGGFGLGNPMNLAVAIAVYASMSKELGLPLRFPGKLGAYNKLLEMTCWPTPPCGPPPTRAAPTRHSTSPTATCFAGTRCGPASPARFFDLEVAPPLPLPLREVMADKEPRWQARMHKHGLAPHTYQQVFCWNFADAVFSWDYDLLADGSKARRFGFHELVNTDVMFKGIFGELRRRKVIP